MSGAPVLLTGATGHVGRRLLRALEREGLPLCAMSRRAGASAAVTSSSSESVQGLTLDVNGHDGRV
jgi:uncharacterized protein YbjT (DUF2867 family)